VNHELSCQTVAECVSQYVELERARERVASASPFSRRYFCATAMQKDPVEGVAVELLDDGNMFEWTIYIEGPKDTP